MAVEAKERTIQIPLRTDILDKMEKYIDEVNGSGRLLYKYKQRQFIAEAILEYIANHLEEGT